MGLCNNGQPCRSAQPCQTLLSTFWGPLLLCTQPWPRICPVGKHKLQPRSCVSPGVFPLDWCTDKLVSFSFIFCLLCASFFSFLGAAVIFSFMRRGGNSCPHLYKGCTGASQAHTPCAHFIIIMAASSVFVRCFQES